MGRHRFAAGAAALALASAVGGAAAFPSTVGAAGPVSAEAGGPYKVKEGSTLSITGTGSSTNPGPVSFAWTPADRFASDPNVATTSVAGHDDGLEFLTLTVTDSLGETQGDMAKLTTLNVKPTMPDLMMDAVAGPGNELVLSAHMSDAGLADTHSATVSWGDGSSSPASVVQAAGSADWTASHSYAAGGIYTLSVTAQDDDAGTVTWSQPLAVGCTVMGTPGDDVLVGTPGNDVICGLGGNDVIHAGAGNDDIYGGDGDDQIEGEAGRDSMYGNAGTDMTSGGADPDACHGAEVRLNCRLSWWRVPGA